MIDAHSAESNEKSIFRFLFFSSYGWWYLKFTGDTPGLFKWVSNQKKSRSKMVKLTEKMSNELKRLKNQFSDFFFTYGRFWTKKIDQFWALSELRIYRQITQFFLQTILPSVLIRFLWMMRSVLNRMKKILRFLFSELSWKIHQKLEWWRHKNDHNSKNKIRKNLKFNFSFDPADSGSFM